MLKVVDSATEAMGCQQSFSKIGRICMKREEMCERYFNLCNSLRDWVNLDEGYDYSGIIKNELPSAAGALCLFEKLC